MTDWAVIADLGTAGGTAILAVATFVSTRSANRAARVSERALLEGLRPLLVPSHWQDPVQKVRFIDDHWIPVRGGHACVEVTPSTAYLVMSLRNVGHGMAILHGWDMPEQDDGPHSDPADFRMLTRDIYVPPGDQGFWQAAVRDPRDPLLARLAHAAATREQVRIDLLYSDVEGGQRAITRMALVAPPNAAAHGDEDRGWALAAAKHWNLDRPDPR